MSANRNSLSSLPKRQRRDCSLSTSSRTGSSKSIFQSRKMQQPLQRFPCPLLLLRPRKMEMRDQLVSRGHVDAVVAVVDVEKNRLLIQHRLLLLRTRNHQLLRSRLRVKLRAPKSDRAVSVSLALKRSTSFVARLNHW